MIDKFLKMAGIDPVMFMREFETMKGEVAQVIAHFDAQMKMVAEQQRVILAQQDAILNAMRAAAGEPAAPARVIEHAEQEA